MPFGYQHDDFQEQLAEIEPYLEQRMSCHDL